MTAGVHHNSHAFGYRSSADSGDVSGLVSIRGPNADGVRFARKAIRRDVNVITAGGKLTPGVGADHNVITTGGDIAGRIGAQGDVIVAAAVVNHCLITDGGVTTTGL